nr:MULTISPECIES: tetratricopeptide repeat protein [unclassified Actinoplanes]
MARLVRADETGIAGPVGETADASAHTATDARPKGPGSPVEALSGVAAADALHQPVTAARLGSGSAAGGRATAEHAHRAGRAGQHGDATPVTSRALRPLRRRVPRRDRIALDEERTLRVSADLGRPVVITRPHTERWLDLALVIDASPTMGIWQEKVAGLRTAVRRSGVFRDVRVLRLVTDDVGDLALLTTGGQRHQPSELLDRTGRRLIALVTDGVDDRWHTIEAAAMLARWSAHNPVLTLQVLPPALWHRTALPPLPLRPRQVRPGIWQSTSPYPAEYETSNWIPVAAVDDSSIHRWASTVVSSRPPTLELPAIPVGFLPLADPAGPAMADDPVELVALFHSDSSPTAFALAGYLASAPITLPVARAIQEDLLPASDTGHLAEVLFSGLVERISPPRPEEDPDAVVYDFLPGVRHELLRTRRRDETFRVLRLLGRRSASVAGRLGTVDLFSLAENPSGYLRDHPDSRLAATVAVTVLGGFGGVYADNATRLQLMLEETAAPAPALTNPPALLLKPAPDATAGTQWAAPLELFGSGPVVATASQWAEVHRLALAGRKATIARDVGHRLATVWLRVSRLADVAALSRATLTLGPDANALYDLGRAESGMGRYRDALASYELALHLYRDAGARGDEAAALNNIAFLYNNLGDAAQALAYSERALSIQREVGNRAGEAAALNNIGSVLYTLGDRRQALDRFQQALVIRLEVGDRGGEATTRSNIGNVLLALGDRQQALAHHQQALPIQREIGDRAGEATTLHNLGSLYDDLGDRGQALTYYRQALSLCQEIGDRAGEAGTLSNLGNLYYALDDRQQALACHQRALAIRQELGDRDAEATSRFNLAVLLSQTEQIDDAAAHLRESIRLAEETGHPSLERIRSFLDELQPSGGKRPKGGGQSR